jgi:hypothetical protein
MDEVVEVFALLAIVYMYSSSLRSSEVDRQVQSEVFKLYMEVQTSAHFILHDMMRSVHYLSFRS